MELIGLLQNEIARLNERVSALEVGNHTKDTTINDLTAAMLAKTAEIAAQKITHGAEMAAESLLKMAALAEASVLRSRLAHESGLVEAAQEQAHQTERIANATEQVVETAKVTQIGKGKP